MSEFFLSGYYNFKNVAMQWRNYISFKGTVLDINEIENVAYLSDDSNGAGM